MRNFVRQHPSVLAGLAVTTIGVVALNQALSLDFGDLTRVGAGAFPTIVSILVLLGGVTIISFGFRKGEIALTVPPGLLRAAAGTFGGIIVFAFTIERLGLIPAVALCAFVSSIAAARINWRHTIALVLLLPLMTWLIFAVGLGLRVTAFG
ncbi:tripartite tricarboxylate transporter TctB family protein [Frigidibacter sp. ROC022]|uniref:tripartite tricarboxylate transporter TctB family protein n=1 Tax=Frigidibacter sp. ROC022 TaxID=2971796 RepID=UPI00215A35F0|nr:tripartite tricarboxylate transporter TctB family protein [Frigidibacter sp. ROC022]MCR8724657.1 tripartite tricarboxylate transporter TctB family protein [Frigidibacter sp. ROC022]